MKTHVLTTKDGLEFQLEEDQALKIIYMIEKKEPIVIDENLIQPWDANVRRLPRQKGFFELPAEAKSVFIETPRMKFLTYFATRGCIDFRKERKNIYPALLDYVGPTVDWNTEEAVEFMRKDWDQLQEFNKPNPVTRLDRNEFADYDFYNISGGFCGKCMNGWKPGNQGLKPCACNKSVLTKMGQ